ncbi:hypothetical protein [Ramlibacter alkalitolerans]|jgi:hypothetical protein|uniref:Hpt domain-containing protein n=1 Tax=Ramlibacter alkalitolerans TaxID=2039631 RepID=A0ABS1JTM2_9BURK|nr:hypothetical protein [Ramlibacter alkalitolerans]MBL0427481.1 hypothetical protein [Ramlibacter alkalitolerans]
MNRDQLYSLAPTDRAFREMSGDQKKQVVAAFALEVLKEIRNEGREPDAWESVHLMHALGALHGERLTYALTLIELAIEDPADRAPEAVARIQKELASAETLERAFRDAQARSAPGT